MKYDDFKARVSVMMVAHELGYKYVKGQGMKQPMFILKDERGEVQDCIYIKNPNNYAIQGYWRRHPSPVQRAKGDLIDFVRENKTAFPEFAVARNDVDLVNRVLARFARVELSPADVLRGAMGVAVIQQKPFSQDDWLRTQGPDNSGRSILYARGFSRETVQLFAGNMEMVKSKSSNNKFFNLAFPYKKAGSEMVRGYEIRGFGSFKSKAAGTDSMSACWQAYVGSDPERKATRIRQVHIAESAYDVMSYVEMNRPLLNLDECLFVSTGGQLSDGQLENILDTYKGAALHLHFDADEAGRMYDLRAAALYNHQKLSISPKEECKVFTLGEKVFSIPNEDITFAGFCRKGGLKTAGIVLEKAPSPHKDWNEALQNSKALAEEKKTIDMDPRKEDRRKGIRI